jgi:hypothetical protein
MAGGISSVPDDDDIEEPSDAELAALERELDGFSDDDDEPVAEEEAEEEDDDEDDAPDLRKLLAALGGRAGASAAAAKAPAAPAVKAPARPPAAPQTQEIDDVAGAVRLLQYLADENLLALEDGAPLSELGAGVARILAAARNPVAAAGRLSKWLLAQPQVAELYIDDGALEDLLARW